MNCSVKFLDPTRTGCWAYTTEHSSAAASTITMRTGFTESSQRVWRCGASTAHSERRPWRASIGVDVRLLGDAGPADRLGALHRCEFRGGVADRLGTEAGDLLPDIGLAQRFHDFAVQSFDDRSRRARWRHQRVPGRRFEIRKPLLRNRR